MAKGNSKPAPVRQTRARQAGAQERKRYSPHVEAGLQVYDAANDFFHELYPYLSWVEDQVKRGAFNQPNLVDTGFLLREMENKLNELRKECTKKKDQVSRLLGLLAAKDAAGKGEKMTSVTVRGEIARATPDMRLEAVPPARGSPEYKAFLTDMGVKPEIIEIGVLAPHWKGVGDLATQLTKSGVKLPPGLTRTMPVYTATFVRLPDSPIGGGNVKSESEDSESEASKG